MKYKLTTKLWKFIFYFSNLLCSKIKQKVPLKFWNIFKIWLFCLNIISNFSSKVIVSVVWVAYSLNSFSSGTCVSGIGECCISSDGVCSSWVSLAKILMFFDGEVSLFSLSVHHYHSLFGHHSNDCNFATPRKRGSKPLDVQEGI